MYIFSLILVNVAIVSQSGALSSKPVDVQDALSQKKNLSILLIHSFFPSHCFPLISLGAELVSRGHRVSVIGSLLEEYERKIHNVVEANGMSYIDVPLMNAGSFERFREIAKGDSNSSYATNLIESLYNGMKYIKDANYLLKIRQVVDTLNGSEYDYIIAEQAASPLLYYISSKWNTSNTMMLILQLELVPRYIIPWPYPRYTSPFTDNMSFLDRLLNTAIFLPAEQSLVWFVYILVSYADIGEGIPSDMLSLTLYQPTLYNTVIGLDWAKTTVPLQHYVGPMFLPNPSPLDPALSEWISKQSTPIVFISMGTTAEITPEMAEAFLSLSEKYRLVWSLRDSNRNVLDGLSVNSEAVYISNWIAQFTLLQNPLVKVAILHCGLNGVQEALYNQVPVLCIPYGIDQLDNAHRLSYRKYGMSLAPEQMTKEKLSESVELLKGSEYQKQVNKISRLYKAAGGAKRGADLVELYAEIGYDHGLPSFVRYQWNFIQYYNIDVWIVLVSLLILLVWGCGKCCNCCCRRCCSYKEPKNKTKRD